MANINSLPVEVLDNICELFTWPHKLDDEVEDQNEARETLASLCRSSRRLHQVSLPHLYRNISLRAQSAPLIPFTRTLLEDQNLADLVRTIDLDYDHGLNRDQTIENHLATQEPDFLAGEVVRTDGTVTGCGEWYDTRIIDLLFSKLQNVERLTIHVVDWNYGRDPFTYIRDKHLDDRQFLCRLNEVIVCNMETGFEMGSISALLSVIPVQKMRVVHCFEVLEFDSCCLPSLLELRLEDSGLDNTKLARLLKSCPNLQFFFYKIDKIDPYWDEMGFNDGRIGGAEGMSRAIRHLKKRLKALSLDFMHPMDQAKTPMDSFVEFSKLKSLKIEMYALAGRREDISAAKDQPSEWWVESDDYTVALQPWLHKLPKSLERLYISRARFSGAEISNLASRANTDFPNLRLLCVDAELGLERLFQDTKIEYIDSTNPLWFKTVTKDELWNEGDSYRQ